MAVMLVYAREASQLESKVPSQWSGLCILRRQRGHARRLEDLPQAVNSPGIDWSSGRVGIPELSLEVEGEFVSEYIDFMHLGVPAAAAHQGR